MLIQSIFYPLEMYTKRRTGISLQLVVQGPTYEGKTNGQVTVVDASAILDAQALHVFAVNRSVDESAVVRVDLADREIAALESADLLTGPDAKEANSFEQPDVVKTQPLDDVNVADGKATVELPPLSVAAMTFRL